ncbi:MAG: hypothetical protein LBT95_00780 [Treponema sp.]|nr:hypothetical protein [Treponema sp.]
MVTGEPGIGARESGSRKSSAGHVCVSYNRTGKGVHCGAGNTGVSKSSIGTREPGSRKPGTGQACVSDNRTGKGVPTGTGIIVGVGNLGSRKPSAGFA